MQILSAELVRAWDKFTIEQEPVASIDLMERAANACVNWILSKKWQPGTYRVFCGKGNNGGDGLAIGRLLLQKGLPVSFYILELGKPGTEDFQVNLQRLHQLQSPAIHYIQDTVTLPSLQENDIVIDALFGSGLNKPLEGISALLAEHLNQTQCRTVSIDLPSGLFMDRSSVGNAVVHADYTLTFQCYKTALLIQENAPFIGEVQVLDIGLHPGFLQTQKITDHLLDERLIRKLVKPRNRFSHKGNFGHALIVGGSHGKMGAMVLATKACLSAGAGLTTTLVPACGYTILQCTAPEAMAITDVNENHLSALPADIERFDSIGLGPGMGTHADTQTLLSFLVRRYHKPLVIDADGLNCLSMNQDLLLHLQVQSILTPHPKEFDRLFGPQKDDFSRLKKAKEMAASLKVVIILKGHHTLIALPSGDCFFNSTGNAGMAKGGSGDVLTGILTALLAQGYGAAEAAQVGCYLHGWAGDIAAGKWSQHAMLPSHLIDCLATVFLLLESRQDSENCNR